MKTFKSKYSGILFLTLFLFSCIQPDDGQWAKQGGGENYDAAGELL